MTRVFALLITALVLLPCAGRTANADAPISASLEIDAGARPGTMSIIWSLRGPYAMPMFSVDPEKVRVSFRKVGAMMPGLAVPKSTKRFDASRVSMTNFDALQAFVPFADVAVPGGSYVVQSDARDALAWSGAAENVLLVTPPAYVYVTGTDVAHQPDAEIKALTRSFATKDAVVRIPFLVNCENVGLETVATDSRLQVTRFMRGASEQIGNGPNGVHAARPTGPNGVGETANAFTALTAIDVRFAHVKIDGKPDCDVASIGFASLADVDRYLRPVPAL